MNDSSSGVAISAAKIRSPSFSRSASSTTTTGLPAAMSAIARSTVLNPLTGPPFGMLQCGDADAHWSDPAPLRSATRSLNLSVMPRLEQALDVLRQYVD